MSQAHWDRYFMGLAQMVASKSKDRSVWIGCVLVGPDHEIRSTGYNGFPRGIDDEVEARHERPEKYRWTEHAERNAVYAAARVGTPLKGCTAYLSWMPCVDCARALIQAGIVEVVCGSMDRISDPTFAFETSLVMLAEAGVTVRFAETVSPDRVVY